MQKDKIFILLLTCLLCAFSSPTLAQTLLENPSPKDTVITRKNSLVLHIGGGGSYYIAGINLRPIGLENSIQRMSAATTFRLMWYPNHRLRLGIESGYTNFYSYRVESGSQKGRVSLNAIPVLFIWSMPVVRRVNVYAGLGTYILNTHLTYLGEVKSKVISLGTNFAVSYTHPFSRLVGIAAEAKFMNAFETKDATMSLQVQLVWKFFQW